MESAKKKRVKKFRITLIALFGITVLIISFLKSITVRSTPVELRLTVSELTFRITEDWNIFSIATKSIGISNLDDLTLEILSAQRATEYDETDKPVAWQTITASPQLNIRGAGPNWGITVESEYLNLTSLHLASGSLVTISRDDLKKNQLNIRVSDGSILGSIDTGDTLIFTCSDCQIADGWTGNSPSQSLRIATFDNQLQFQDLQQLIQIQVETPAQDSQSAPTDLGEFIPIQSVDFTRLEDDKTVSTVVTDGTLILKELNNKSIGIRGGDFVIMDNLRNIQIKEIKLDRELNLILQGHSGVLETGTGTFMNSRMPSLLDWLYANQLVGFLIATIIPFFLAILAILDRLQLFPKFERRKL